MKSSHMLFLLPYLCELSIKHFLNCLYGCMFAKVFSKSRLYTLIYEEEIFENMALFDCFLPFLSHAVA